MPIALRRTVRFSPDDDPAGVNGEGGVPSFRGLGRHYELDVSCIGSPDPDTGFLINIKDIDKAVRTLAVPAIARACRERPDADPPTVLREIVALLSHALTCEVRGLRWRLTPYHSVEMSTNAPARVLIRQQFEFAASHRLHVPSLSPDQNRALFGKCNAENGHGHNYRVEPCVEVATDSAFTLRDLERSVDETVIRRFDHTHLNLDTREFATGKGVNPTVENIARVAFDLLSPVLSRLPGSPVLRSVTVWETDRTCATYPA